jgi:replicative DNA helicase
MVEQRGGEKRPQLSDLRESGAIEQDADLVMFVYRPEYYLSHLMPGDPDLEAAKGKAEIIVAKQRNGPTGTVMLSFLKEFARFENLAEDIGSSMPHPEGDTPF